jgi:hypothetical protein
VQKIYKLKKSEKLIEKLNGNVKKDKKGLKIKI